MKPISIGRFSQLTRLTPRALRFYDDLGLLRPALTDPDNGYRYYRLEQLQTAEQIRVLRELGISLEDIRALLRDPQHQRLRLEQHRERLLAQLNAQHQRIRRLTRLIEGGTPVDYNVNLRNLPAQPILCIHTRASLETVGPESKAGFGELFGYLAGLGVPPAGPGYLAYPDPEFNEDDFGLDICLPVAADVKPHGRMQRIERPAMRVAFAMHSGPYDGLHQAYQAVNTWVQRRDLEQDGPTLEIYHAGPGDTSDPAQFRTEAAIPVRVAGELQE